MPKLRAKTAEKLLQPSIVMAAIIDCALLLAVLRQTRQIDSVDVFYVPQIS